MKKLLGQYGTSTIMYWPIGIHRYIIASIGILCEHRRVATLTREDIVCHMLVRVATVLVVGYPNVDSPPLTPGGLSSDTKPLVESTKTDSTTTDSSMLDAHIVIEPAVAFRKKWNTTSLQLTFEPRANHRTRPKSATRSPTASSICTCSPFTECTPSPSLEDQSPLYSEFRIRYECSSIQYVVPPTESTSIPSPIAERKITSDAPISPSKVFSYILRRQPTLL